LRTSFVKCCMTASSIIDCSSSMSDIGAYIENIFGECDLRALNIVKYTSAVVYDEVRIQYRIQLRVSSGQPFAVYT
jgi:hypothetical protein